MIKQVNILLIIVLAAWLFLGCERKNTVRDDFSLTLGLNANYPPYESYDRDGKIHGFDVDVAEALAHKLGLRLTIKDISFDALILALNQGKIDIVMSGMSITSSRQKEIAMVPYQGEEVKNLSLAFWKDIPPSIQSLTDIANSDHHVIAVQVGTYQEAYLNTVSGIAIKALDGTQDLIMDLQYGKSQAVLFEPHIADAMKNTFSEIQLLPIDLPEEEWVLGNGIGIKKNNRELVEKMEIAIKELQEEGIIHALEQKWFGEGKNVG